MIQFKFNHRYVSDIDLMLRKPDQKQADQPSASHQTAPQTAMALLPESTLPFAFKKQDDGPKTSF